MALAFQRNTENQLLPGARPRRGLHWRAGILLGLAVAIAGLGIFAIVGSSVDYACKNTTPGAPICRVYLSVNHAISAYSDLWRSVFAKRCVGGQGPDDCLGPDVGIMAGTLFVIGFVPGIFIWRKKPKLTLKIKHNKLL